MTATITPGMIVEVLEPGRTKGPFAVVVEPSADDIPPNDHETFVWVRYDNGCVVPVRERWVSAPPSCNCGRGDA